jgi:serine O-acetyltransferase
MLIEGIAKLLGGSWVLKERSRSSTNEYIRTINSFIYTKALQAKGSWIHVDAQFGSVPYFPHGIYGIFISGGAIIGSNCVIFQQVTIGSNTLIDSSGLGAPIIGDNCYIGTGAKIIGNIKIGRNVRVGANAVVVNDVPDNAVVTVGEQRIMKRQQPMNNRFYNRYHGQWRYYEDSTWHNVASTKEIALLESRFPSKQL